MVTTPSNKQSPTSIRRTFGLIATLIVLLIGALLAPYFFEFHEAFSSNPESWASFGSYVGGTIGSLFAGGSLFGLLVLLYLQSHTNALAREELQATKEYHQYQDYSIAVFELVRVLSALRAEIEWSSSNLYPPRAGDQWYKGDIAISATFHGTFATLHDPGSWDEDGPERTVKMAYREFKKAHQAFGKYWTTLREALDELRFRGTGLSVEIRRRGLRLLLATLHPREYSIFCLMHCVNKEWDRLEFFRSSNMLERIEDYEAQRIEACIEWAKSDSTQYETTPQDHAEIEATGDGLRRYTDSS